MSGRGYSIFETALGRCGIAWGHAGVLGVQLPEAREIETRRHLLREFGDAREQPPPEAIDLAVQTICALLRGERSDVSQPALDMHGIPPFNRRVYEFIRTIPRGETRTWTDIAIGLRASGASHAVSQAVARNPFAILVPCHRVLQSVGNTDGAAANGGTVTRRRLLSIEGALTRSGPTLFDVLLSAAPLRPQS